MTRQLRIGLVCWMIGGFSGSAVLAGEMVDNPTYKHWAKFKPGTYVVTKTVQEAMGHKTETIMTTTLKSVSGEKVVVEMTSVTKTAGQEIKMPPQSLTHAARIEKTEVPAEAQPKPDDKKPDTKEGKADIEIAGKKVKTTWYEVTADMGSVKTHTKSWMCEDVPGQVVKTVSRTEGEMPMTVESVVVEYKVIK